MKNNIQAAWQGKNEKVLDTKVRYEEGIMTRRQWLKMWLVKGATVKEMQVPKIAFNRVKFNRMGSIGEQAEYERKCNEMKTGYFLYINDRTSYDLTKTEYDYFNDLQLAEDKATEAMELSYKIEAGIASDAEIEESMQKEFEYAAKYF